MLDSHRGARANNPFSQPADRRIQVLDSDLRIAEVASSALPVTGMQRDSQRVSMPLSRRLTPQGRLVFGVVVHAIPHLHSYKVQFSTDGTMICSDGTQTGFAPLGPRSVGSYPPNSVVLVYLTPGRSFGLILSVLPPLVFDSYFNCPDWIVQGGGSGLKREGAHQFPLTGTYAAGGIHDFSNSRPLDSTSMEKGFATMLGGCLTLDDYMMQIRVNEMCGLWLHWHDSYARLAGMQMTIESLVHEWRVRDDEGESRFFHGVATYPYESLGLYAPGQDLAAEIDDKAVHYSAPKGKVDLPDGFEDTQPIYRYQEFRGYEGQGSYRAVVAPSKTTGVRRRRDAPSDIGLFRETIALNGAYSLVSAKSVYIGKRCNIVTPQETRLPEDGLGDDARANNYRFSGLFGDGPPHRVGDLQITGDAPNLRQAAAIDDVIAYALNWQGVHPFHYHAKDYALPQESAGGFRRTLDLLDFRETTPGAPMSSPTPVTVRVDHRYGDVKYFQRESFLVFHDDGTVQLGCGYGGHMLFSGGDIEISTPRSLKLLPGGELVALASQIALRAKGSVDVSSTDKNVSIKAEMMVSMLGGNSGTGGVFIESRGRGDKQNYHNRYGEDAVGNGIVLKATDGTCAVLGQDLYLRSLAGGTVTIDADRGQADVNVYANNQNSFVAGSVAILCGPTADTSDVRATYLLAADSATLDASLFVGGQIVGFGSNSQLSVRGDIRSAGSIAAAESLASREGGPAGRVPPGFQTQLESQLAVSQDASKRLRTAGTKLHKATIVSRYYKTSQLGNETTIADLEFSFRDPPVGDQYKSAGLLWPEARWQTLARLGGGLGGVAWQEKSVMCHGVPTYPYPGRKRWTTDATFLQLEDLTLFNPATGLSRDRPGPYENPTLAGWRRVPPDNNYTLVR